MRKLRSALIFSLGTLLFSCSSSKKTALPAGGDIIVNTNAGTPAATPSRVDPGASYDPIQIKYAGWLRTSPDQVRNIQLYRFIDGWMYTPYKWGGTDKTGIDCSSFMQKLLLEVYQIDIPRTSVEQFFAEWIDRFGSARYLSEGDLVFFQTIGDNVVSHVGLYLGNRMFVNSSSSKGVSIASLDDPYWKSRFVAAGRVKLSMILKKQN
jgi:hypothetical protein